jgi:hypothetical protein
MNMRKHIFKTLIAAGLWAVTLTSCEKDEYKVPDPVSALSNDCIKRTLGPNIATLPIEFVYAMAIPKSKGKLAFAEVKASIPGAPGTYLEHRSFYTNSSGVDVPVTVGTPSVTDGATTKMNFTVDTSAASLRFYYIVPNEARGKQGNSPSPSRQATDPRPTMKWGLTMSPEWRSSGTSPFPTITWLSCRSQT